MSKLGKPARNDRRHSFDLLQEILQSFIRVIDIEL
jgi:hypothetical protein